MTIKELKAFITNLDSGLDDKELLYVDFYGDEKVEIYIDEATDKVLMVGE